MSSPPRVQFAELERDNIGRQRAKFDIIATTLYICNNGSLKNHIVGKGNFRDPMANHYISILLYNELLSTYVENENNGRTYYRTTNKGRNLRAIIHKLFLSEGVE
jgi:predicted transcriptional regulator